MLGGLDIVFAISKPPNTEIAYARVAIGFLFQLICIAYLATVRLDDFGARVKFTFWKSPWLSAVHATVVTEFHFAGLGTILEF